MKNNEEEANIKKMAELLRKGATMLDLTCPQCENILFRYENGRIYCPSCEKEVVIQKDSQNSIERIEGKLPIETDPKKNIGNFNNEIKVLRKKITYLCTTLENTNQLNLIEININLIRKLLDLYKDFLNL